jgi:benzodiazapine receptor
MNALSISIGVAPLVLGTLSGWLGRVSREWYDRLERPAFTPPSWVFGVVWPLLYVLIGVAAVMNTTNSYVVWVLFGLQLLCNVLFSPVNFRAKSLMGGAILTTLTLVFSLALAGVWVSTSNTISVLCFVPYLCWLIFATGLAWTFVHKN